MPLPVPPLRAGADWVGRMAVTADDIEAGMAEVAAFSTFGMSAGWFVPPNEEGGGVGDAAPAIGEGLAECAEAEEDVDRARKAAVAVAPPP